MTNAFPYPTLKDADIQNKKVLLRAGFDLPITDGIIDDVSRIEAVLPTLKYILDAGASLILMAHQGRPKGEHNPEMSQRPLVSVLSNMLGVDVKFAESCRGSETKQLAAALKPGEVLLLENLRFEAAEKSKNQEERDALGKELAALADLYVNDAFTNCHRDHASMTSVPKYIPGYLGLQVEEEIRHLASISQNPKHPITLIISGAKMETKVPVVEHFLTTGDDILLGGLIANTFMAASGQDMGKSKIENEWKEKAIELLELASTEENATIHIPQDAVREDDCAYDVGPETVKRYEEIIAKSGTVIWNGPLGMYEEERFAAASKVISSAIADVSKDGATTIIGGGDTVDFHTRYHVSMEDYTWVCMGGGAMLEFISGQQLPAFEALKK